MLTCREYQFFDCRNINRLMFLPNDGAFRQMMIVIGKEPGSTVITIYTSDNKFSAYCALTVTEPSNVKFEPLCVLT